MNQQLQAIYCILFPFNQIYPLQGMNCFIYFRGNVNHISPVHLTLPCEDICPYSRYPILVQMILLKEAIFTIWQFYHFHHCLARILCLAEEASLIGRLHFKSFHNYTIILEMHVCMLLRLHQFTALSAQFRTRFLFSGCKFPSFSSK